VTSTDPLRITLLVHNLTGSPVGRALPLAAALARDHAVTISGLVAHDAGVNPVYRDVLPIVSVPGHPLQPRALARLARQVRADVVMACKPLPDTLVPALIAARRSGCAVILDVDDDEWSESRVAGTGWHAWIRRNADLHAPLARLIHPLTRRVHATTVTTHALQRRYGGTIVRHGPDESVFDPSLHADAAAAVRRRYGLPAGRRLALFCGVPRGHKGWDTLLDALVHPAAAEWDLVATGDPQSPLHRLARERLGARFHALGFVPHGDVPALLAAAHAAPVPQHRVPFAESQLPAKLLDALAMAVPVVATAVGDLPEILGGNERGWLVPPGDAPALAAALADIVARPEVAAARGAAGRAWFLAEASVAANRDRLGAVVREALAARDMERTPPAGAWT
jgi:glycosyltransferase involved in cell wall biosynthesis